MKEKLIGREETAGILGVSVNTVDIFRAKGDLKAVPTPGNRIYFRRSEVLLLKRRRVAKLRKEAKRKSRKGNQGIKASKSETPNN